MTEHRVVNTSPLIYLSRANLLELLGDGAERVIVPQAVSDEIFAWPTADAAQLAIRSTSWLTTVPEESIPSLVAAWDLGKGETGVLTYGVSHPGSTLILDDLAARRCATSLNIPVRGTLGLVLRAKKRGLINSAREALLQLRDAGMYLSDAVSDAALRQIGE